MAISQKSTNAQLGQLCGQELSPTNIILASNRGPIEYYFTEDRQLCSRRGSGGVVTAFSSLARHVELNWITSAMGEGDREAARRAQGERFKIEAFDENLYLRFVTSPRNIYHKYYSVICNPLLWFLQHYMWSSSRTPNIDYAVHDAWDNGYVLVNQAFAQSIITEAAGSEIPPVIIINDYHLYLVSNYIRQQMPNLAIQHFIHIPWPSPSYWQLLPSSMRQAIHRSLCTTNIVGLQTGRDVHNFLHCCQSLIDNADVDYKQQTVRINEHITHVKAYPISVDVVGLKKIISSPGLKEYQEKLRPLYGEQTIVRVDRAEPSKNIIRGFRAFDRLLEQYPQFVGKVKLVAFLVPTRTHLRPYQRYIREVTQLIESINNKYRNKEWYPIDYFYENNYIQAIAGMCMYDVLLVNAVIDGMNLVAKEGPTVNNRDGVLILSETVGAYEQLGQDALTVAPADLEGTTQALYAALTMSVDEKHKRAIRLKKSIEEEDITNWLLRLLKDAVNLTQQRPERAT
ncbi:trehalose-6-phosphate synthase [Chloroflexota bacterium]